MSRTRETLKKIASGEPYRNLVSAVDKADYAAILSAYTEISRLVEEAEKEIVDQIQTLPRRNKDEDSRKFRAALNQRARAALPVWHRLNSELQKQRIMDGVVFGFGSKGDPMVRTPEGRIVVLSGAKLKEGDKAKFKVITEGEKVSFGSLYELNPETFYYVLSEDTRQKIRGILASVRERINARPDTDGKDGLAGLSGPLKELEDARELASQLRSEERERIIAQVLSYRRKLLENSITGLIFDFISREEVREIAEHLGELPAGATAGLFRREAHEALKARLFTGDELRGYSDAVKRLENDIDSMDSAVQLLDFKAGIDRGYAPARRYVERMDRFFERLSEKARAFALRLAEDRIHDPAHVDSTIAEGFSAAALCAELRRVFRSADEFFTLREALSDLMSKLGDAESLQAEAAIRPYLRGKVALAFGEKARLSV